MQPHLPSGLQAKQPTPELRRAVGVLFALWLVIFFAALFTPPLLDDADATHAQAARAIVTTGDWVTLHVNGIRYLEKPPLPYWLVAITFRCFGFNAFAAHLPGALAVLGLAMLAFAWGHRSFGARAGFYAGIATLTCTGVFLFTRVFIPDALLSMLLALALYAFDRALPDGQRRRFALLLWLALALAVLTKGLVVLVLFGFTALLYFACTREHRHWRRLQPLTGIALFLAIAAPWHILASLRNTGGQGGHGFAWFYFVNEHVLRFLGRRIPRDYNKLPALLYWSLQMLWLFPWSLFGLPAIVLMVRKLRGTTRQPAELSPQARTVILLSIFSAVVLIFFSLSTNQEYYTFPAYLPLLLLVALAIARAEASFDNDRELRVSLHAAHALFVALGLALAATLAVALYRSRTFARPADIGSLLAHRGVSNYTLSMASFFDLTGPSFAALRLPAAITLVAFSIGPAAAWLLRARGRHLAATTTIALTSAVFLIAAHIALTRFTPMLSSKNFADRITTLENTQQIEPGSEVVLFGDQAYGSSIAFYLHRRVMLVDGRTTSMYFGSTFADAPAVFLTPQQLRAQWGKGPRKILFIPAERHDDALRLLGPNQVVLAATSGKLLLTDRPLTPLQPAR